MTEAHCDGSVGTPTCIENLCDPSTSWCSPDGTEALTCDARGTEVTNEACTRGCAADTCRPETPCGEGFHSTVTSSVLFEVDLCAEDASFAHTANCSWDDQSEPGEDILIRLEVDRARDIRIEAYKISAGAEPIDPDVYLRSDCVDMASEIWCHEDTGHDLTDTQDEDVTESFEPGDYFLIVDRHERDGSSCGVLQVVITYL